jgi:hypothetical protein
MKISKAVVLTTICLVALTTAVAASLAPPPAVTVAGVYENFTVGRESGDLEGMRVIILPAGGGYYAIVQIAQGGAEDPKPEFVPADVKGKTATFSVGDEKFVATANATALTVKDSTGQSHVLKRKACASYFK